MGTFEFIKWYHDDDVNIEDDEVSLFIWYKFNGVQKLFKIKKENINYILLLSQVNGCINNEIGKITINVDNKYKEIYHWEYFEKYFNDNDARQVAQHLFKKFYT